MDWVAWVTGLARTQPWLLELEWRTYAVGIEGAKGQRHSQAKVFLGALGYNPELKRGQVTKLATRKLEEKGARQEKQGRKNGGLEAFLGQWSQITAELTGTQ